MIHSKVTNQNTDQEILTTVVPKLVEAEEDQVSHSGHLSQRSQRKCLKRIDQTHEAIKRYLKSFMMNSTFSGKN
jgi:hypothetical protein